MVRSSFYSRHCAPAACVKIMIPTIRVGDAGCGVCIVKGSEGIQIGYVLKVL